MYYFSRSTVPLRLLSTPHPFQPNTLNPSRKLKSLTPSCVCWTLRRSLQVPPWRRSMLTRLSSLKERRRTICVPHRLPGIIQLIVQTTSKATLAAAAGDRIRIGPLPYLTSMPLMSSRLPFRMTLTTSTFTILWNFRPSRKTTCNQWCRINIFDSETAVLFSMFSHFFFSVPLYIDSSPFPLLH